MVVEYEMVFLGDCSWCFVILDLVLAAGSCFVVFQK